MLAQRMNDEAPNGIAETPIRPAQPFAISRVAKPRGAALPIHAHDEAQLTFAASGMVQVHTAEGVWLVPPQLAAWVPARIPHRLEILTDADLWMVHWRSTAVQAWAPSASLQRPFALRVTPLLHTLLTSVATVDHASDKAELLVRLMLHELTAMPDAPTFLPLPTSPVGRRMADLALGDHRGLMDLDELASRAATSVRTASRVFPLETGMTFRAWRQRARIVRTMGQLARGKAVAQVADEAGFASTAAFSCAFRQVTAMTPTAFLSLPDRG